MIEHMSTFPRVYEPDQIDAFVTTYLDRRIRPFGRVMDMARHGQLQTIDGRDVRAFEPNEGTFRGYVARERKRRQGGTKGSALDNPDDVLEGMRKRMIRVAEQELRHWERKRPGNRDPEQLRQVTRLLREVAALPKQGEGRSRTPGRRDEQGAMVDGASGGLAGKMLAAHRRGDTAPEPPSMTKAPAENASATSPTRSHDDKDEPGDEPGSEQRDLASLMASRARTGIGTAA